MVDRCKSEYLVVFLDTDIHERGLRWEHLMTPARRLHVLEFDRSRYRDQDWAQVQQLLLRYDRLVHLEYKTSPGLIFPSFLIINNCSTLRYLHLEGWDLPFGFAELISANIPELEVLTVKNCLWLGVSGVFDLPKLHSLNTDNARIVSKYTWHVPSLKYADIMYTPEEADESEHGGDTTPYTPITSILPTSLIALDISDVEMPILLHDLQRFTQIEYLSVENIFLPAPWPKDPPEWPKLEDVELNFTQPEFWTYRSSSMQFLNRQEFPQLKSLVLYVCEEIEPEDQEDWDALEQMFRDVDVSLSCVSYGKKVQSEPEDYTW